MFSEVLNDSKVRLLHWHGCQGSWLEEFLDGQSDEELDTLLARLDVLGCEGLDACLGTLLCPLDADGPSDRGIELMVLHGRQTQLIIARRGEHALVLHAGQTTENLDLRQLRETAERQLNQLARQPLEGEANDGTG